MPLTCALGMVTIVNFISCVSYYKKVLKKKARAELYSPDRGTSSKNITCWHLSQDRAMLHSRDPTTDYEPGPTARCPDARSSVPSRVSVTAIQPPLPKNKLCSQEQKSLKEKKPAENIRAFADNTVLDILTKMDTKINPQKHALNYIPGHMSPEHFKQAPKFGELSLGIACLCLSWCKPQLSFISCVALGKLSNLTDL